LSGGKLFVCGIAADRRGHDEVFGGGEAGFGEVDFAFEGAENFVADLVLLAEMEEGGL